MFVFFFSFNSIIIYILHAFLFFSLSGYSFGQNKENFTEAFDGSLNATKRDERNVILRTTVHVKEGISYSYFCTFYLAFLKCMI